MARLTFGLLSIICVVVFSAAVKGKSYVRERDPYSRASYLFRFGNSLGYGRDISDWAYSEDFDDFSSSESDETTSEIIKSSNGSTSIHLKDEDYPDSSEGEYIELSSEAQSTENVSTNMPTSQDNAVASTTLQPLNTILKKGKGFSTTAEKIHAISRSSSIGNYSKEDEVSFVSTPTTSDVTSSGAQDISPNSTLYNSTSATESSSSIQVRSTNSSEKLPYTITPGDHKNTTVSSIKILATQDDNDVSSTVSLSSLDGSTNSPSVTSVINTDERIRGETYTTVSNNVTSVVSFSSLNASTRSPTVISITHTDEINDDSSGVSSSVPFSSLDVSTSSPTVISVPNTDETTRPTTIFSELTSGTSFLSLDISKNSPAVISITNTEETKIAETYTTVSPQSTYSQSSSTETKSSSTQLVIKTTKLAELTTTAAEEEKSDVITEAISPVSEAAKNRSLKLVVSVVFLIIALISMAVLVTYVIRAKRMDVQYDELTLLP